MAADQACPDQAWANMASEAIDRLAVFGPVIMMGFESVRRRMGGEVERKEFVRAKSVYALLKTHFERNGSDEGEQLLEQFVKEPDTHQRQMVDLIATKAAHTPQDLGRKLVALTNRWREEKRPLPPA